MRVAGRACLLLSIALAAAHANAALAATAPVPKTFGVSEPGAWRADPPRATPHDIARLIAGIGANSQRFVVYWQTVEPTAPVAGRHHYDWREFDSMYGADLAHGIRPLIVVLGSPPWAWDRRARYRGDAQNPPAAAHYADWRAFVAAVARRYPRAVGIEVWNEPNIPAFWGKGDPLLPPNPVRYVALLCQAHQAIKSVDPAIPVVGGALSNVEVSEPNAGISGASFALAMFRLGAANCMDGVSVHPYPAGGSLERFSAGLDSIRDARAAVGAVTPIWITEVGATTSGIDPDARVSEQAQADELVAIYRRFLAMPDVSALYLHTLVPPVDDPYNSEMGFALVGGSTPGGLFAPKPAYLALRSVTRPLTSPPGELSVR